MDRGSSLHGCATYTFRSKKWGGKRESNPQPPEPQSGALPVELFPPQELHYSNLAGRRRDFGPRISARVRSSRAGVQAARTARPARFRTRAGRCFALRRRGSFSGGTVVDIMSIRNAPIKRSMAVKMV